MSADFSFDTLQRLQDQHVALRLFRANNFPLIASFFHLVFIRPNRRAIPYQELIAQLDHHLTDIEELVGEGAYTKSAKAYVDDWINLNGGYLRKYLPQNSDEPECDLLPDVEKALRWLEELQGRQFVGTETRLKLLLDLIHELVQGTSEDATSKLADLELQRKRLDEQINAVRQGLDEGLSDTQIRERLFLLSDISRRLLGDFRQVEANFRRLDKETRQKITQSNLFKGQLLDRVFEDQDAIEGSDEGQSFSAFFELLMTPAMRENMRDDLKALLTHEQGRAFVLSDELLMHLYTFLLEAGTKVNQTRQQITDQLRRYIQEQSQDNKRILDLIREFEASALSSNLESLHRLRDFSSIETSLPEISQLFSRTLYQAPNEVELTAPINLTTDEPDVDLSHLFALSHINETQLMNQVHKTLNQHQGQASLSQVVDAFPIEQGLDEVLTYIKLACEQAIPAKVDTLQYELIKWPLDQDQVRTLRVPLITFTRTL